MATYIIRLTNHRAGTTGHVQKYPRLPVWGGPAREWKTERGARGWVEKNGSAWTRAGYVISVEKLGA